MRRGAVICSPARGGARGARRFRGAVTICAAFCAKETAAALCGGGRGGANGACRGTGRVAPEHALQGGALGRKGSNGGPALRGANAVPVSSLCPPLSGPTSRVGVATALPLTPLCRLSMSAITESSAARAAIVALRA